MVAFQGIRAQGLSECLAKKDVLVLSLSVEWWGRRCYSSEFPGAMVAFLTPARGDISDVRSGGHVYCSLILDSAWLDFGARVGFTVFPDAGGRCVSAMASFWRGAACAY
jgi:hypothetical protein